MWRITVRVKFIIGWLYAVILCLIYGLLLSAYGLFRFHDRSLFLSLLFLALPAVFIGCCFGVSWFCRKRNLDSRGYWRFALLVLLTIPVACLMHDAAPIEHDYSIKDIVPGDQKILESYSTLMLFRKDGGMKVETTITSSNYPDLLTNALAHAESISRDWDSIAEARAIMEKLDTYPGIADLTPQVQLGTNTPTPNFVTLRSISWAYAAYANLKTAEGYLEEGVKQLAKIQSVTRKVLPYSATIVDKMIWIWIARNNIEAAFAIMQQPQCNSETLEILKTSFPPITEEDISLRRVFITQYIGYKAICEVVLRPSNFLDFFVFTEVGKPLPAPSFIRKATSPLVYYLTFRKNRTFRDLRKRTDLLIEGAGRHPPDMSQANNFIYNHDLHPVINNLGGWYLVNIVIMASFTSISEAAVKIKILNDLLAIEIGDRLNQPVVLNDYYSDGPYRRDKLTGRPFSVGPDKKPNTDDDIVLGKK